MIEKLQKNDFYNSTIQEININYTDDKLTISFELNEENDSKTLKLIFIDFSHLDIQHIQF